MGLPVAIQNIVRMVAPNLYAAGEAQAHINPRGDALVAFGLPAAAEIVRMGESYGVVQATAVAPVAALPTTTAQVSLWNGEADGGKSYVIDSLFCSVVVSAASATSIGFAGMINKGRVAAMVADLTPFGLAGHNYAGKGRVDLAATVVDDGWHAIGNSITGAASQIGQTVDVPLNGLYIIPPGGAFSMAVLANTASTITVKMGLRWHEIAIPLG
jgi:hypothetical protein